MGAVVRSLSTDLLERILGRFGFSGPPTIDRQGLDRLYAAWCLHVPFDNTRKLIALRTGAAGPLPGIDPVDFLETWLEHGPGGTCWPSCNALFAVVAACGFDAQRTTASMMDMGAPNHGTIVVRLGDDDYLVDSSMLLNRALRLRTEETVVDEDPLRPVEYETVDGAIRLWFTSPVQPEGSYLPCRLLTRGVAEPVFQGAYEASRHAGPFNHHLVITQNFTDRVEAFHGSRQVTRRPDGVLETNEHDASSLREALLATLRLSPEFLQSLVSSGALDVSAGGHQGPTGPETARIPPSRRP